MSVITLEELISTDFAQAVLNLALLATFSLHSDLEQKSPAISSPPQKDLQPITIMIAKESSY